VRRPAGFTILEIIVVLLMLSIIAATVLGRSITSSSIDLTSATDKIRNQLRFAQAQAMKRSDTVWGIKGTAGQSGEYWLFRGISPDDTANQVRLPGVDYAGTSNRISTASLGVTLDNFIIIFNRIGKPYTAYTDYNDDTKNDALGSQRTITVTAAGGSQKRYITVESETGLVQ
jgi:prepilin-type N-terminal cleavage/methylation domain-containing protein